MAFAACLGWTVPPFALADAPGVSLPDEDSPFLRQRSEHVLDAIFGLPVVASRARSSGRWELSLEQGNSFMGGVEGDERVVLDGESGELALRHLRRLGRCWHAEASLPIVFHHGGWADRAIDDWHRFFGLPDAQRDSAPAFDLRYEWGARDGPRALEREAAGLGDVQLALQRPLRCTEGGEARGGTLARVGVKLPSGDPERLLGSGATDLYADLQSPIVAIAPRWRFGAAIGVLATGRSELVDAQRPLVGYGAFALSWAPHARWRALAQLDWHTPFRDSELRELGSFAASLAVGLRYRAGATDELGLSISEDVVVDTAPDIVARLSWVRRTGR